MTLKLIGAGLDDTAEVIKHDLVGLLVLSDRRFT